jgi:NAD(P)-dependent dehydrogenase (short-subunit alcohol dehydrogenase family)
MSSATHTGQTALVTGAASGIGRAAALAFSAAGARVALLDIDSAGGTAVAEEIHRSGGEAIFLRCDVTSTEGVAKAHQDSIERFGAIDWAFNNAGVEEEQARLAEASEALFDRTMAINVKGVWLCMRAQLAHMAARGSGGIVNTASVAGLVGAPMHAVYAASKHAVIGLTRSAAAEYGKRGVRVNAVCPGVIRTPMLERAIEREPRVGDSVRKLHPIGRIGEAEEVAKAVLWLCSGAASFVTGHALTVDGGMTAV